MVTVRKTYTGQYGIESVLGVLNDPVAWTSFVPFEVAVKTAYELMQHPAYRLDLREPPPFTTVKQGSLSFKTFQAGLGTAKGSGQPGVSNYMTDFMATAAGESPTLTTGTTVAADTTTSLVKCTADNFGINQIAAVLQDDGTVETFFVYSEGVAGSLVPGIKLSAAPTALNVMPGGVCLKCVEDWAGPTLQFQILGEIDEECAQILGAVLKPKLDAIAWNKPAQLSWESMIASWIEPTGVAQVPPTLTNPGVSGLGRFTIAPAGSAIDGLSLTRTQLAIDFGTQLNGLTALGTVDPLFYNYHRPGNATEVTIGFDRNANPPGDLTRWRDAVRAAAAVPFQIHCQFGNVHGNTVSYSFPYMGVIAEPEPGVYEDSVIQQVKFRAIQGSTLPVWLMAIH